MTVLFFGSLSEITGTHQLTMEPIGDVWSLKQQLEEQFPELRGKAYRMTVNVDFVDEKNHGLVKSLAPGDEVALLPPYAGG